MGSARTVGALVGCLVTASCNFGSGAAFMAEPLVPDDPRPTSPAPRGGGGAGARRVTRTIGGAGPEQASGEGADGRAAGPLEGRILGTFKNTYYDFPREADHGGETIALMDGSCRPIATVPRRFYDSVCVQGSGALKRGGTVSFARRDCPCAEVCPRTGQRICFDALDPQAFPWGRGAAGRPITPLRSVAADTNVLPMGTVIYVPEFDGVARSSGEPIDGCFVVEDRGLHVRGEHIDVFTGDRAETHHYGSRIPTGQGVTVVVDSPRCAHLRGR